MNADQYSNFKQLFAQVSNPPIDPIRERLVMSLFTRIGEGHNILEESPLHTKQIHISQPVLLNADLEKITRLEHLGYPTKGLFGHFWEVLFYYCSTFAEIIRR